MYSRSLHIAFEILLKLLHVFFDHELHLPAECRCLSTFFDNVFYERIIEGRARMIGWPDVSMPVIFIISNLISSTKRRIASDPVIFKLVIFVQIL